MQETSAKGFFILCRAPEASEARSRNRMYYDPNAKLTLDKHEAAKFASLNTIHEFINEHGINMNQFYIVGCEASKKGG